MRALAIVAVFAAAAVAAGVGHAAPDADAKALATSAKQAASEARFCDAMNLYSLAFTRTKEAKYLYNAAEVAFAGSDRIRALQLYREVLDKYPAFDRKAKVVERIGELGRAIAQDGVGNACPVDAPVCGNGTVEAVERCDDGNATDGDGCDATCVVTACGNGIVTAGEACDDGNLANDDGCSSACTRPGGKQLAPPTPSRRITGQASPTQEYPGCGNGAVDPGEGCDDGDRDSGDGCDENCTVSICGNGVVASGETCDDRNAVDGDGCDTNCTRTACGNGIVTGDEHCDDGNVIAGDGCTDCRGESGPPLEVVNVPPAPSSSLLPWVLTGSIASLFGATATIVGYYPALSYLQGNQQLRQLDDDFGRANAQNRTTIAALAGPLHDRLETDLGNHNTWGRFVGPLGVGVAVAGVGIAIAGFVVTGDESAP